MAMAHSVEGRFPFLDHRVVEFASRLPVRLKMKGLNEKYVLKKAIRDLLPAEVATRTKQPYMAPDILSFFGESTPEYVEHYLSESVLLQSGMFRPDAVKKLKIKCQNKNRQSFRENMSLVGILSSQILYDKMAAGFTIEPPAIDSNMRKINQ